MPNSKPRPTHRRADEVLVTRSDGRAAGVLAAGCAVAAGLCVALIAGCGEQDGVRVYQVETDEPTERSAGVSPPPAGAGVPTAPDAQPEAASDEPWMAPAGWRRSAEERPMRLATFTAGEGDEAVEVAVSRFPGDVGGVLANVNRWRGQVGLGPVAEDDLDAILTPFENPGFAGYTMRLEGPENHMLAAIIHEGGADRTWFVKAVAPPERADRVEDEVLGFARSFGASGAEPGGSR